QWTRERIIEEILTRVLRNAPLGARTVQPRALADAGAKFFGSWGAALAAAGIDPAPHVSRWRDIGTNSKPVLQLASDLVEVGLPPERRRGQRWTNEGVTNAILSRQRDRRAIN